MNAKKRVVGVWTSIYPQHWGVREKSRIPYSCGDEGKRGMVVELPNKAFYLEDAPLS
jgi:hypothetical protein